MFLTQHVYTALIAILPHRGQQERGNSTWLAGCYHTEFSPTIKAHNHHFRKCIYCHYSNKVNHNQNHYTYTPLLFKQYTSTVYRDHGGFIPFHKIISTRKQSHYNCMTPWQYWLGRNKCLQSGLKCFRKVGTSSTDWLIICCSEGILGLANIIWLLKMIFYGPHSSPTVVPTIQVLHDKRNDIM